MASCLGCAAPAPLTRCAGCGIARFCGKDCQKLAWSGHKAFCARPGAAPPALRAEDIARAAAEDYSASGHEDVWQEDSQVQAEVLEALGMREGGVILGQRPVSEREIWDMVTNGKRGLARLLFGRNAFRGSFLPMLRTLTQDLRWPTVCSARDQAHVTEFPTFEVCCAVTIRVLCVARRLRAAGHRRLIFVGIGSGDALAEACIALHLAAALGLTVDLDAGPPLRLSYGDMEISIVATDSPDSMVRQRNRTLSAPAEMPLLPLDRREAVRTYAAEAPLYVFCCWMPMGAAGWRGDVEEDAGGRLAEACFLTSPPTLIKVHESALRSKIRPSVELFPQTFGRWDFLARGFEDAGGEEAGLFHSQLYVFPDPKSPPPFLAEPLRHSRGNYVSRMMENETLQGVNYCRGIGLYHIHGPDDFEEEIPVGHLYSLRESALANQMAVDAGSLQEQLRDCLYFLSGQGHKQISALLKDLQVFWRAGARG